MVMIVPEERRGTLDKETYLAEGETDTARERPKNALSTMSAQEVY